MLVPAGKTNFRALPSSLRLQPAIFATDEPALNNSTQSGKVVPLLTDEKFSAAISFSRTLPSAGVEEPAPGVPPATELDRQFAGSSGLPNGSIISSDDPPPSAATGQPPPSE